MVEPIKVGILVLGTWMGGIVYAQNLVKALTELSKEQTLGLEIALITDSDLNSDSFVSHLITDKLHLPTGSQQTFRQKVYGRILNKAFKVDPLGSALNKLAREKGINFLYPIPYGIKLPKITNYSWAGWIPDFQHKYMPELFPAKLIRERDQGCKYLARSAREIVASSQVCAQDLRRFFPDFSAKLTVLNFRTVVEKDWMLADPLAIQAKYSLPDSFFLVSNQFWVHKNHMVVLEALVRLLRQGCCPTVVCTGSTQDYRDPDYFHKLRNYVEINNLGQYVRFVGVIPRLEQIQLMRRSLAVIQPSLFEGWSTVVEDARALGKALILSDIPVHLEQSPPYAMYFSSRDPDDLSSKMKDVFLSKVPGPDVSLEQEALAYSSYLVKSFGKCFLDIIYSSVKRT